MTMRPLRPAKLLKELEANAACNIPSMVWGGPGQGKSDLARALAKKLGAKLFELRANLFDPVDVRGGLKIVEQQTLSGTTEYVTRYGRPEDYPDSSYQGPVMLFVDELPNASKATQNALLQLILDKKIGSYELPPQTVIVAAGNRASDRAAVNEMPTPVKNRFAHYEITANVDDWVGWALQNNVDSTLIGFIRFRGADLLSKPDYKENAFPTPRSWAMLDRKLKTMNPKDTESQIAGAEALVGEGAAGEFITYRAVESQMPSIDDILNNPGTAKIPSETSVMFAVAGACASRADHTTLPAIIKYAGRMPPEYQMITLRDCLQKDRSLLNHQDFAKWALANASVLI